VVAALRAHSGAANVQDYGCYALGHLTTSHAANKTAVAAAGGIEAVVAALRAHSGAANVQERGCYALAHLTTSHAANQTAVAAAGGIEAVVAALRAHSGAANVQDYGCYALRVLAGTPARTAAIKRAGTIKLAEVARARFAPETEAHKEAVQLLAVLR
jgi:hypothetical protein